MISKIMKDANKQAWLLLDLAISFMVCIFAPVDIYYANKEEFWFSLGQMLSVCLIYFLLVSILLGGLFFALNKLGKRQVVMAGILMAFIYFYIQGNYIPRNYGVMDGTDIAWEDFIGYGIASVIAACICVVVFLIIVYKFRDKIVLLVKGAALFVLLIQIVTITTLIIQKGITPAEATEVTTTKGLMDFSADNNIIVVLLDTYDGEDFNHLIDEEYNKQASIFEDFTYYQDTLGAYPTTKCALPHILTGKWYQNDVPYEDYVEESYINNEIYSAFAANDYGLDMYTGALYLSSDISMYENIETGWYKIKSIPAFAGKLFKMVAFNYMPHQIKQFFVYDTDEMSSLKTSTTNETVFSSDVIGFKEDYLDKGINVTKEGNVFKFIHLNGVHGPFTFDEKLVENKNGDYSSYDEAAGCNVLMDKFFSELKDNGIYDSSTIIIMADHGHFGHSQNPIFLIKNAYENHEFQISETPMSWDYLDSVWIALANGENVDESFIKDCNSKEGDRRFLYYRWDDAWARDYMPGMEEMICEGLAGGEENLIPTGKTYYASTEDHTYRLGKTLDFVDGRNAYTYVPYGITYGNVSSEALMQFDIEGEYKNLRVDINLSEYCGIGTVALYANDSIIAEFLYVPTEETLSFIIPHEYVANGKLDLKFVQNDNSETAAFEGTSLGLYDIKISSTEEEFNLDSQRTAYKYSIGDVIDFSDAEKSAQYIKSGFSGAEDWGAWTLGDEALLRFRLNKNTDLVFTMNYMIFDEKQHVEIYANGELLDRYVAKGTETHTFVIPEELLIGDYLDVKFALPDAHSHASLNDGVGDARELALGFTSISIEEIYKYSFGSDISFAGDAADFLKFNYKGFSTPEPSGTWTVGNEAEIDVRLKDYENDDLVLTMNYMTYHEKQHVKVYVGEKMVEEYDAAGDEVKKIHIPGSCVEDGILKLRFELPDASSPKENGESGDERTLALFMKSMKIDKE